MWPGSDPLESLWTRQNTFSMFTLVVFICGFKSSVCLRSESDLTHQTLLANYRSFILFQCREVKTVRTLVRNEGCDLSVHQRNPPLFSLNFSVWSKLFLLLSCVKRFRILIYYERRYTMQSKQSLAQFSSNVLLREQFHC